MRKECKYTKELNISDRPVCHTTIIVECEVNLQLNLLVGIGLNIEDENRKIGQRKDFFFKEKKDGRGLYQESLFLSRVMHEQ